MKKIVTLSLILTAAIGSMSRVSRAQSSQPYIDELKKSGEVKDDANSGSYTEQVRKKLDAQKDDAPAAESSEGYSEKVKRELLQNKKPDASGSSYTEEEKAKLGTKAEGGAIQALKDGNSELAARYKEGPHHAAGLRVGAGMNHDVSASSDVQGADFDSLYGGNFVPDITFFYDYQFLRNSYAGSLGLYFSLGFSYFHGFGQFGIQLPAPIVTGADPQPAFPLTSQTLFQFFFIPVAVGLDYRVILFKYLQPYAIVAPTLISFTELRNDGGTSHRGDSRGIYAAAGASLLLDWISPKGAWDFYTDSGIQHTYLSVEYSRLSTLSGGVTYTASGVAAGITFEY